MHGDKRGSVDKRHNRYGTAFLGQNCSRQMKEHSILKNQPLELTQQLRRAVLRAIIGVRDARKWFAHAVHVRSNHVHIVVSGKERPEKMMVDFKSYATRAIKRNNNMQKLIKKFWTQHGSTKYLWTKESLVSAIKYVKNEQGKMMEFGSTNIIRAPNVSEG
jgi:REP element-mobilizing transposase RayT